MSQTEQQNILGKKIFYGGIIALVIILLTTAYTSNVFAEEQNRSMSKHRPQADEIKAKLAAKALASEQRRQADAIIAKQVQESKKTAQNYLKPPSVADSIKMQYKLFADAKQQKKLELQIRTDILKKDIKKKFQIDKFVKSGNVKLHEYTKFQYGGSISNKTK